MRTLIFLLLALLVLYGGLVGVIALFQRQILYPGAFQPPRQRLAAPAGTEAVTVPTADGESLHGLWSPPRRGCGIVVTFHGNGSNPEAHAERFAGAPWRKAGWGVLAIAYRGYPGSTGRPSEAGLIEDGLSAYRFAEVRAPGAPILLHGHSLGAAVAIAVAGQRSHLGLYLEAPFDSMSHAARLHFPYLPTDWLLRDTYRSDTRIRGGTQPVFIVHGRNDPVVPAKLGMRLAAAAGSRTRIRVVPGDHDTIFGSRDPEAESLFATYVEEGCAERPSASAP